MLNFGQYSRSSNTDFDCSGTFTVYLWLQVCVPWSVTVIHSHWVNTVIITLANSVMASPLCLFHKK